MFRLAILVALLFGLSLAGCDPKTDSSHTIDRIVALQEKLAEHDGDSSAIFLKELRELTFEDSFLVPDSLKAETEYLTGLEVRKSGNLDSASFHFQNSANLVNDSISKDRHASYFSATWFAYYRLQKFGDCMALNRQFRSLIADTTWHEMMIRTHYYNERVYAAIKEYDSSLVHNKKRVAAIRNVEDTINIAGALVSRAELYFYHFDNPKKAFSILDYLIARDSVLTNNYKRQLYGTYGIFLYYQGEFERALGYYKKGLEFIKQRRESRSKFSQLANSYNNIGEVHIDLKLYETATKYLDTVRDLGFDKIDTRIQKDYLRYRLRIAYETGGNFADILDDLKSIDDHREQVYLDKSEQELVALSNAKEYEKQLLAEKQETEIRNLQLQNRFLIAIAIAALLIGVGIFFFRNRKLRFERSQLQMQQRLLGTQMNPHYTSNALYSAQNLIKTNPKEAAQFLLRFSRQLRLVLENSTRNYVDLEDELDALKAYLELQQFRFPEKFDYSLELQGFEEDEPIFIPPMLIQPFVENSIEHGFAGIERKGMIQISMKKEERTIRCTIKDNGIGLNGDTDARGSSSTSLISEFIKKATGTEVSRTSTQDSGTVVQFAIPFKYTDHD